MHQVELYLFLTNLVFMLRKIKKIHVYIPNLEERIERKDSIIRQFKMKSEFLLTIVPAIRNQIGAWGLWQTFIKIVEEEYRNGSDFFIFCEDDHIFTRNYCLQYLQENITAANARGADLLSGGVSWLQDAIQCTEHLFWIRAFNGLQFTVIYKRFYKKILNSNLHEGYVTDFYLSTLSDNKFVIYPFISRQREFGYSDVTDTNNEKGYINKLFRNTDKSLYILNKVRSFYQDIRHEIL